MFITLLTLLLSTDPQLKHVAEPLRLFAFLPGSAAIIISVKEFRYWHDTGKLARSNEASLATAGSIPYFSGETAWIGRGPTFAKQVASGGSISIDSQMLVLKDSDGNPLVEVPSASVAIHRVPIWFGLGVRLEMGNLGSWFVQPHYSPTSPMTGRRATKRLKAAIAASRTEK
jgi:hypothetical protein